MDRKVFGHGCGKCVPDYDGGCLLPHGQLRLPPPTKGDVSLRCSTGFLMGVLQVAIVGRPNVGKSSLLNWLAGRRLAIVHPSSGVTRDRVTYLVEIRDRYVELVDTGGMGIEDPDNL